MSSNTLMETLKIEFTEIGDNYVVCKMPVTPEVHQPAGILHGGATAALVETAGSFASRYFIKDREMAIRGVEISTNHVKSIKLISLHSKLGLNHFVRPMFYGSKHAIENISSNSESTSFSLATRLLS